MRRAGGDAPQRRPAVRRGAPAAPHRAPRGERWTARRPRRPCARSSSWQVPPVPASRPWPWPSLEALIDRGYQVCLVDPEGDYEHLEELVVLGNAERPLRARRGARGTRRPRPQRGREPARAGDRRTPAVHRRHSWRSCMSFAPCWAAATGSSWTKPITSCPSHWRPDDPGPAPPWSSLECCSSRSIPSGWRVGHPRAGRPARGLGPRRPARPSCKSRRRSDAAARGQMARRRGAASCGASIGPSLVHAST